MIRLLYLLAVVYVTAACRHICGHHEHGGHTRHNHNRLFEEISNKVIAADKKLQNFCVANSNGATKEIIDSQTYQLRTPLANYQENEVEVKIRHRVLYIDADKPPLQRYSEIRLLPNFVDTKQANFQLVDGILIINFNIKTQATENCSDNVDSDVITVPKLEDETFTLGGNERMGSNYKR
ncbi:unnamed protein product [Diatraea saccharalis]|uniref:Uncharacterized protein n=1 Tax=Diatraea saccharalis TaxID=40085 RepID=A0A9N9WIB6_9NEOP|nr:unnamed protein product [Diatraea saccharalis]